MGVLLLTWKEMAKASSTVFPLCTASVRPWTQQVTGSLRIGGWSFREGKCLVDRLDSGAPACLRYQPV